MPIINMVYKKKKGWQPGANTIVYIPMKTDLLSHTTNPITVTNNNSVSIVSSGTGASIPVAYFGGASRSLAFTNTANMSGAWTIQVWEKVALEGTVAWVFTQGTPNGKQILTFGYQASASRGLSVSNYSQDVDTNSTAGRDSSWHLLTVTYSGVASATNNINIYVDGTLIKSGTTNGFNLANNNAQLGRYSTSDKWNGWMSEFILENRVRTAQEVSDYYNLTKGNYGVSESQASSCFLAGTPVLIEGGSKPIDELNIGDVVLSYNKSTGEKEYNKVVDIIEHTETKDLLYTLDIEGQRIEATEFHKFYISDNKEDWRWEEIRNLKEGQFVFSIGGAKKINSVESKKFDGPCYNITVDNNHNYFVYEGILVHNTMSVN